MATDPPTPPADTLLTGPVPRTGEPRTGEPRTGEPRTGEPRIGEPPLQRLRRAGAEALGDAELLAVLLGDERKLDLAAAAQLLAQTGGLAGLASAGGEPLPPRLAALRELAVRLCRTPLATGPVLDRPAELVKYLDLRYGQPGQTVSGVLYVDACQRAFAERVLFRGTVRRLVLTPPAILRDGLLIGAAGLIFFSTHPGGDPIPSPKEHDFARRLREAGDLVGLRLVDCFILATPEKWYSFEQRGTW